MEPDQHLVRPGSKVDLASVDAGGTDGFDGDKAAGAVALAILNEQLADLQQLLYAEAKHKVLIVLQGMDTSGKDGTIKHVFRQINPLGVHVANFKRPNDRELAHDYLWRVHQHTPSNGHITIFNRSHYEDVLVVRVHDLISRKQCKKRFQHIREFERMLSDEGTVIRKFFLHIDKNEQKERLEERITNTAKNWKFEHGDVEERRLWDDYQTAYEDAIAETSTEWAPWYVIPANRKWYRNIAISTTLVHTLEDLDMSYPPPRPDLDQIVID